MSANCDYAVIVVPATLVNNLPFQCILCTECGSGIRMKIDRKKPVLLQMRIDDLSGTKFCLCQSCATLDVAAYLCG